jgi:hypothetical protein
MAMTRRRVIAGAGAVLVALGPAAYAVAVEQPDTVASYTGCLRNGKIESVAPGDAPLAPCAAGAAQIRVGGGDITAVAAGSGLAGGGANGDLTIAADTSVLQARVSGGCLGSRSSPTDASIGAIHTDGTVTCNPDDAGDGAKVIAGFADGPGDIPTGAPLTPIRELALPKGKYAISATVDVSAGFDYGHANLECRLVAGADFDRAHIDLQGLLGVLADDTTPYEERIALSVAHEFTEPGAAVLKCKDDGSGPGPAQWNFLKITAIRVATLTNAPLTLP